MSRVNTTGFGNIPLAEITNTIDVDTSLLATEVNLNNARFELVGIKENTDKITTCDTDQVSGHVTTGIYLDTPPGLNHGEVHSLMMTSDATLLTTQVTSEMPLQDGVSNDVVLPTGSQGTARYQAVMPYVFNGETWDRLTGSTTGLKTTIGNIVSTREHIRDQRASGNCFFWSGTGSSSSSTEMIGLLWNPVGSGNTLYVYNVILNAATSATTGSAVTVRMRAISAFTAGTSPSTSTLRNLKLGTSNDNDSILYTGLGSGHSITANGSIHNDQVVTGGNSASNTSIIDFQEDFIEIPAGNGLQFMWDSNSTPITINYTAGIRYIKSSDQL